MSYFSASVMWYPLRIFWEDKFGQLPEEDWPEFEGLKRRELPLIKYTMKNFTYKIYHSISTCRRLKLDLSLTLY
jgi:hypothetical protein